MRPLGEIFPPELEGLDPVARGKILVEALWKPRGGVKVIPYEPAPPPEFGCEQCGFEPTGLVYKAPHVDHFHPDFGKIIGCPGCRGAYYQQRALERIFAELEMPEEYRTLTAESYARLADADHMALARVVALRESGPSTLYLYGDTGRGKTFFAWHLVCGWIAAGATGVLFVTELELLDRIRAGYGEHVSVTAQEVFDAIKRAPILVVDDLGSTTNVTPWVIQELFGLVDYREKHHLATIYTSNLPIDGLEATLGARTVSRLRKHCGANVIWVDGIDQRRVAS